MKLNEDSKGKRARPRLLAGIYLIVYVLGCAEKTAVEKKAGSQVPVELRDPSGAQSSRASFRDLGPVKAVFDPKFEEFFLRDALLLDGHTRIVNGPRGRYVIAPGSTAAEGKSIGVMQRVAEVTAKRNLASFLEVQVSSEIRVDAEETEEGAKESVRIVVVERTEQFVRKAQTVGRWFSHDEQEYYVAVAVAVPNTFIEEEL